MDTIDTRHTQGRDGFTVAVIGGGAAGALTAYHLLRASMPGGTSLHVALIEPRASLGLGLAYSTPSLQHLLNVPAGKISAIPSQPDHFLSWLRMHHDPDAQPGTFAPRAIFGQYIQALAGSVEGMQHVRAQVVDYRQEPDGHGAVLTLSNGTTMRADRVVLATGNFDPAPLPGITSAAVTNKLYAHNAWIPAAFDDLEADAPVTLIGSGLTAVDVLLRLREQGHTGKLTMVSRHAALPQRHAPYTPAEHPVIPAGAPATALAYLRAVRAALASGTEWRAAVDSLRASTNALWLALPLHEQRRFRRHLQHRWEIVRHRMAPPIADIIEAELAAESLVLREGSLAGVDEQENMALVTSHKGQVFETHTAARVINCTGPDMRYDRVKSRLLRSLFRQGVATSGPHGGGFCCNAAGALLDAAGRPSQILFNLGPGRLGTLLESIAMPEIREQAFSLVQLLATEAADAAHSARKWTDDRAEAQPTRTTAYRSQYAEAVPALAAFREKTEGAPLHD